MRIERAERRAQLLQNLADKLPHLAQGMIRGNPPLRLDVRKHPPLIENSPRIANPPAESEGKVNHHPFAVARFFSKLLVPSEGYSTGILKIQPETPSQSAPLQILWTVLAGFRPSWSILNFTDFQVTC